MNFDHFLKYILSHKNRITNYNRVKKILNHYYSVIKLNRQKLKLGNIVFLINEFDINKPFKELITIKFINQDTSNSDEEKLQRFDEELGWKWTKAHVFSLILVLTFCVYYLFKFLTNWLHQHLPSFYDDFYFEEILKISLELALNSIFLPITMKILSLNTIDLIFQFCLFFHILI